MLTDSSAGPGTTPVSHSASVLVCTYRRQRQLAELLDDLRQQTHTPSEIVVVDNDAGGSARETVEAFRLQTSIPVLYDVQPIKNISITRNRTIELASGPWLAFIDDDERASPRWLENLLLAASQYGVEGVQGPVIYKVPPNAPAWLRRADHYGLQREPTGTPVTPNRAWIGNTLLRASAVAELAGPFDEAFGLTGGEDTDMMGRLMLRGHDVVWCDEAVVEEPVSPSRMRVRWLWLRALRGGQDFTIHWQRGLFGPVTPFRKLSFVLMSLAKLSVSGVVAFLTLPLGLHRSMPWQRRCAANIGKLSALLGMRYREYAAAPAETSLAQNRTPLR